MTAIILACIGILLIAMVFWCVPPVACARLARWSERLRACRHLVLARRAMTSPPLLYPQPRSRSPALRPCAAPCEIRI